MDELSRYGRTQRFLELGGLSLFASLLGLNLLALPFQPILVLHALAGWVAADLLSGVAHWAFDRFGSIHTPVFGPAFIRPFREHHVDPAAMTRHDFVETNGSSCLAFAPVLALALFLPPFLQAFLTFTALGVLMTNQCHKWAHMDRPSRLVSLFQRANLVLKPQIHRLHHTPPFRSHYCTASGWLNPVLDKILR
ncbi:MAG TPA: fatty acid desaturase CarF family protein [Burkholderiales bacterium]|nr:fatty acid desaturase CarF family protein [Burkholderiales bacterium]